MIDSSSVARSATAFPAFPSALTLPALRTALLAAALLGLADGLAVPCRAESPALVREETDALSRADAPSSALPVRDAAPSAAERIPPRAILRAAGDRGAGPQPAPSPAAGTQPVAAFAPFAPIRTGASVRPGPARTALYAHPALAP